MSAFSKVYGPAKRVTDGSTTPLRLLKRGVRVVENFGHSALIVSKDQQISLVSPETLRNYIRAGLVGNRLVPGDYHPDMIGPVNLVNDRIGLAVWQSDDQVYVERV